MTLGDYPELDLSAHPITRKVWMRRKNPITHQNEDAEIFEDGFTKYFNSEGLSIGAERFSTQKVAVKKLKLKGYKH